MFIDSDDIKKVIPEVVKIRRHIHMYPEISEQEYETSKYIKKCLDSIDIEISVEDKDIYINVSFGIEGLNGEDFLGSHILSALIESRDNYKIEFNVE